MKLVLRNVTGETITLEVNQGDTFRDLKARIFEQSGIQLDLEQLNYKGKKITDDQIITKYFFEGGPKKNPLDHKRDEVTLQEEAVIPTIEECSVPGCNNSVSLCPGKTFFNFPAENDRCQHWLLVSKRLDLLDKASSYVSQFHAICQDHFDVDQFVDDLRLHLKPGAIPTIIDVDYLGDEGDQIIADGIGVRGRSVKEEPLYYESDSEDIDLVSDAEDDIMDDAESSGLLCRLCATSISDTVVFIYSQAGQELNVAQKINMALPVAIRSADPLPKQLCMTCLDKLNMFHEFSETCVLAERKLRRLNRKRVFKSGLGPPINDVETIVPDRVKESKIDIEDKEDEKLVEGVKESVDVYCCPLCRLGDMAIHDSCDPQNMRDEVRKMDGFPGLLHGEESEESSYEDIDNEDNMLGLGTDSSLTNPEVNRTCRFCMEIYDTVEMCLTHGKSHAENAEYPCNLCDLSFTTEIAFEMHWTYHKVLEMKITCRTCGKLINKKNMHEHVCSSTLKAFKCTVSQCGKFFRSEERLAFHQRVHEGANPVVCGYCSKSFSREANLYDHVRMVHKGEKPFCCTTCGKTFQLKARLLAHNRVHTGERPFECEICGGRFYNNATLKGHRVTHMEMKPFQCDKCGRCFARKALFNQHQMVHMSETIPKQQRACKICGEIVFGSYAKLLEHRKLNHPGAPVKEESPSSKPFKCEECGKSFAYRVTLVTHLRKHSGELPFECQFCEKRFSQKRSLILHERTHTGEKPFECDVCGKRFAQSAHMYSHIRLHTGEKPYSCEFCNATFRLKDVKDAHVRKHTGERPYRCEVCEKKFRTSHSYYQHMWIHQGKKPYPCGYCGKAFRRSNGLKIHIRIHTGEKPHVCPVCNRGFAQKQDMKKHMNLHLSGKL